MRLASGANLGHYTVTAPLGAGGMDRALDTKLDRDVAIKVLPEDFAADAERVARFEREAKSLAALNHPRRSGEDPGFRARQGDGGRACRGGIRSHEVADLDGAVIGTWRDHGDCRPHVAGAGTGWRCRSSLSCVGPGRVPLRGSGGAAAELSIPASVRVEDGSQYVCVRDDDADLEDPFARIDVRTTLPAVDG